MNIAQLPLSKRGQALQELLESRIVFMDGAMGTMIQNYNLSESDYRGTRFKDSKIDLKGNNELLVFSKPELIRKIHSEFIEAGADIIETNTFNANSISQKDYELEKYAQELNVEAARLAKEVADEYEEKLGRQVFVAGALGPTNRTASLSPKVEDPGYRAVTFDDLVECYYEQAKALVEGGVDALLPETTFDTLNLKAAIFAIHRLFLEIGYRLPVHLYRNLPFL